jgi:hypothetical protein
MRTEGAGEEIDGVARAKRGVENVVEIGADAQ